MSKIKTLSQKLTMPNVQNMLTGLVGEKKQEFTSSLIAMSDNNKSLENCETGDLIKCAMNSVSIGLSLNKNLGHAYVIPYNTGGKTIPQFQIGYKGLIQLAIRSEQYKTINVTIVRACEIESNKFTGEFNFLGENPSGEIVGYLSYLKLNCGFEKYFYMTKEQVTEHAKKYSQAYGFDLRTNKTNSPWSTDFDAMALKTVVKLLLSKWGILRVGEPIAKAIEIDQKAVIDGESVYIDSQAEQPKEQSSEKIETGQIRGEEIDV